MLNTCPSCGTYRADKTVLSEPDRIACPDCGAAFPFLCQQLFILGGASGTGKSTVLRLLTSPETPAVVLDSDVLWSDEWAPEERWPAYFDMWLRLCKNIGQSGKPVLLGGAGFGVPDNVIQCVEARYFSAIHIAALVCEEDELRRRLMVRPESRRTGEIQAIERQLDFNRWYMQFADGSHPQITVFATTGVESDQTAQQILEWMANKLERRP